jgi:hypothetical protein
MFAYSADGRSPPTVSAALARARGDYLYARDL